MSDTVVITAPAGQQADPAQWTFHPGDLPQNIAKPDGGAFVVNVARLDPDAWSDPVVVGAAIAGVEVVQSRLWAPGVTPLDDTGASGAGMFADFTFDDPQEGDLVLVCGACANSTAAALFPGSGTSDTSWATPMPGLELWAQSVSGANNYTYGFIWGPWTAEFPEQLTGLGRWAPKGGVILLLRGAQSAGHIAVAPNITPASNTATIPASEGVVPGSLVIEIADLSDRLNLEGMTVNAISGVDMLINGKVPGSSLTANPFALGISSAEATTVPERQYVFPGGDSTEARGVRLIIAPVT